MLFNNKEINFDVLNEILSIFYYSSLLPIKYIDTNFKILGCFPHSNASENPIIIDQENDYIRILDTLNNCRSINECFLYTNNFQLSYISIGSYDNESLKGCLIAGPFLLQPYYFINLNEIIEKQKFPINIKSKLREFYDSLTVLDNNRVFYLSKLLLTLTEKKLELSEISFVKNNENELEKNETFSKQVLMNREKSLKRPPHVLLKDLYDFVKLGDLDSALEIKKKIKQYGMVDVLGLDAIRNAKNHLIIHCFALTRAAVEGGVDIDFASTLCDTFINSIENSTKIPNLMKISDKMLKEFTESVQKLGESKINPSIQKSLKYINKHFTEDLYLDTVANEVHLHPKYFSSLFKKEVGMSFQNYISKFKIQESKRLLDYTDDSILDIALQLGFKNQSYFTNTFKKYEGCTPYQYRKKRKQQQIL
ncbi:AraC family transcriptional regulator [Oceanirhabdus sp. W0125-5]|uniref:AraC family transcriptional regulator n=1 Tax=Oceanirhabdus sp. W0125-5 TaxID=2999116 RepID=UPI0022F31D7F|nr:AraC family transcriptional regulator [Oceanirhabdus sp. W0125-5]WBW95650.1 AraC family transcriptional regulator [Oceanirhabdus sp. W0125-5]